MESDEPSSSESSSDEGTDYADSDEDVVMEEMLQSEEVEFATAYSSGLKFAA